MFQGVIINKGVLKVGELHVSNQRSLFKENTASFEERQQQLKREEEIEIEQRQREKNSPYRRWLQLNKDAYKAEDWLMAKSPIAYRIFKFLMNNMDSYNAVMVSQTVLHEKFEVSRVTVSRAVSLLKDKKYIEVYKSGTSNIYVINKQIAWNSWGNNYKYGKFSANIIISENEQNDDTKKKIKAQKHKEIIMEDEEK